MKQFQDDTIRMIFSFTDTDPEDITGLDYHGNSNRGTKSVILLNYNGGSQTLPEDAISLDVVVSEVCGNQFEIIKISAFSWTKVHFSKANMAFVSFLNSMLYQGNEPLTGANSFKYLHWKRNIILLW